jgi:hypothetical protein
MRIRVTLRALGWSLHLFPLLSRGLLLWSFAYFEVNEFVPVPFVAVRAFDVIPSLTRNSSNACPRSETNNPTDPLHERNS